MTRFRISLAILLVLLGISIGSMTAVRYSGNAVLEAVRRFLKRHLRPLPNAKRSKLHGKRQNHGCCSLFGEINSWTPLILSIG